MSRVYFIKPIGMDGPIKIGCSRFPEGRRSSLETWSPFPLEVIAEVEGGFDTELRFHQSFAHLHDRREWFRPDAVLLAVIAAINAGTFDLDMLPPVDPALGAKWRARKALPEWHAKQGALTRRAWAAEYASKRRCPVDYRGVYRDGREADIPVIEDFIAHAHRPAHPIQAN